MKGNSLLLLTFVGLVASSQAMASTYTLTAMPTIPERPGAMLKLLEDQIVAFCHGDYGDNKIKGVAKEFCDDLSTVKINEQSVAVTSIKKFGISHKDAQKMIIVLGTAHSQLTDAQDGTREPGAMLVAQRAYYSVLSEMPERTNAIFPGTYVPSLAEKIKTQLARFMMTTFTRGVVQIPFYSGMPDEDIHPHHFMFYSEAERERIGKDAQTLWQALQNKVEQAAARDNEVSNYSLANVSRVLVFDEVKKSATSAKARVKGLDGSDWSIKWGDEMQPEVIANRLWVTAGGKLADMTLIKTADFTTTGGTILLFKTDGGETEACPGIKVIDEASLRACLKASKFKADIGRYTYLSGSLADPQYADLLSHVDQVANEVGGKIKGNEQFVIFREAVVEFQTTKSITKGGPIALRGQMSEDTGMYGLLLWNMWIANHDVKEDNGRSAVVIDKDGNKEYLETLHDQGMSLGTKTSAFEIAGLADNFMEIVDGKISFNEAILYKPEIFTDSDYASMKSMAKRILSITEEDLKWVFAQTNAPEYVRIAAIRKLMLRQLNVAQIFNMPGDVARLNALIEKYSQNYHLYVRISRDSNLKPQIDVWGVLGREEAQHNVLTNDRMLTADLALRLSKKYGFRDVAENVLVKGQLFQPTDTKSIQHDIIEALMPSGIAVRTSRVTDYLSKEEMSGASMHKPTLPNLIKYFKDEMGLGAGAGKNLLKKICEVAAGGSRR